MPFYFRRLLYPSYCFGLDDRLYTHNVYGHFHVLKMEGGNSDNSGNSGNSDNSNNSDNSGGGDGGGGGGGVASGGCFPPTPPWSDSRPVRILEHDPDAHPNPDEVLWDVLRSDLSARGDDDNHLHFAFAVRPTGGSDSRVLLETNTLLADVELSDPHSGAAVSARKLRLAERKGPVLPNRAPLAPLTRPTFWTRTSEEDSSTLDVYRLGGKAGPGLTDAARVSLPPGSVGCGALAACEEDDKVLIVAGGSLSLVDAANGESCWTTRLPEGGGDEDSDEDEGEDEDVAERIHVMASYVEGGLCGCVYSVRPKEGKHEGPARIVIVDKETGAPLLRGETDRKMFWYSGMGGQAGMQCDHNLSVLAAGEYLCVTHTVGADMTLLKVVRSGSKPDGVQFKAKSFCLQRGLFLQERHRRLLEEDQWWGTVSAYPIGVVSRRGGTCLLGSVEVRLTPRDYHLRQEGTLHAPFCLDLEDDSPVWEHEPGGSAAAAWLPLGPLREEWIGYPCCRYWPWFVLENDDDGGGDKEEDGVAAAAVDCGGGSGDGGGGGGREKRIKRARLSGLIERRGDKLRVAFFNQELQITAL